MSVLRTIALVAVASTVSSGLYAATITVPGGHTTIQAAVDAASAGDTIMVDLGIYDRVTIDKSLTLLSNSGPVPPSIDGDGVSQGWAIRIEAGVEDVTIGAADQGFVINAQAGDLAAVYAVGDNENLRLEGNALNGGGGNAFLAGGTGGEGLMSSVLISNVLTNDGTKAMAYVNGQASLGVNSFDVTFEQNTFIADGAGNGVLLGLETDDAQVIDNTFQGQSSYALLELWNAGAAITGNSFFNNGTGTLFKDSAAAYDPALVVEQNLFPQGAVYVEGKNDVHASLQDAIDAAADNDVIRVSPGEYTELMPYSGTSLGLLIDKTLTIQGVSSTGDVISSRQEIQATIISGAESGWGTNFYVTAPNVNISGLTFAAVSAGTDPESSPTTINKAFEITADGFGIQDSVITAAAGYDYDGATSTALYFGDDAPDDLDSFTVDDNEIHGGITITNGAGDGPAVAFTITNNVLSGDHFLRVRGAVDGVGWLNASAHVPTTLSGNDASGVGDYILQVWGEDAEAQIDADFVAALIADNTLGTFAYAVDQDNDLSFFDYSEYGGIAPAFFLRKSIQETADTAADNDNIVIGAGQFQENVSVNKPLALSGPGTGPAAVIKGRISVSAAGAAIAGLEITNPADGYGIVVNGVGDVTIAGNHLHDIGNDAGFNGSVQAIYVHDADVSATPMSDIVISDNFISDIGHGGNANSNKGIFIGDSLADRPLNTVEISGNTIVSVAAKSDDTFANGGRGGYGILINWGVNGAASGVVSGLEVGGNTIETVNGFWVHALGLEGDTPNAVVTDNVFVDLNGTKVVDGGGNESVVDPDDPVPAGSVRDATAIFFEGNPGADTVAVNGNSFAGDIFFGAALHPALLAAFPELTVAAAGNYWGDPFGPGGEGPGAGAGVGDNVAFEPWCTDAECTELSAPAVALTPAAPAFGDVELGQSATAQTVTLTNTGTSTLTVGTLAIGGSAADFALGSDGCSGNTFAPSASCTFAVGFAPAALGARSAQVSVPSNAPASPHLVSLSGTGVQSPGEPPEPPPPEPEVEQTVEPGGSVTNLPPGGKPSAAAPVGASVTTPSGGTVAIKQQPEPPAGDPPPGFTTVLGISMEIEAPPGTVEEPLVLSFVLHSSLFEGMNPMQVVPFIDTGEGEPEPAFDCTGPAGIAEPDPCVSLRMIDADGNLVIEVHTSHASIWIFAIRALEADVPRIPTMQAWGSLLLVTLLLLIGAVEVRRYRP